MNNEIDYLIESLRAVSLLIVDELLSPIILVESEELLMVEVLSVTVVVELVDSVLVLEQAVAKAIIESRKKADFAMLQCVKLS